MHIIFQARGPGMTHRSETCCVNLPMSSVTRAISTRKGCRSTTRAGKMCRESVHIWGAIRCTTLGSLRPLTSLLRPPPCAHPLCTTPTRQGHSDSGRRRPLRGGPPTPHPTPPGAQRLDAVLVVAVGPDAALVVYTRGRLGPVPAGHRRELSLGGPALLEWVS